MAGTNLVRTTLTGVRPLGVRGEPLHQAHEQIRGVVRRRLGERHARLLAEPQPDELGRRIDWYTDLPGTVVPWSELAPERRTSLLAEVETLSSDIASLAASLKASPSDDAQLTGRALELTARRPSDDYIFLVDDQPVIVCWGYEPDAAGALLPPPMVPAAVAPAVATAAPSAVLASGPATLAAATPFSWWRWLLIGLLAILLALILSYFLRQCSPVGPDVAVTQLPPPPAPPAPPPPPDPAVGLRGDLGSAQSDEAKLRATLASLRDELAAKRADCKPPAPPKPPPTPPPPVVEKKPDPPKPPPKPPVVVEKKPDPPKPPVVPPAPPGDDRMRMPKAPTNDYSFLQGCWRTDTFKHGPQIRPGYATYCFDRGGNGSMEFRFDNGVTCRAPATARFNGGQLAVTDADTTCSPRGRWAQDHLFCQPGADGVANCSGSNRTERWTVNLHRVR